MTAGAAAARPGTPEREKASACAYELQSVESHDRHLGRNVETAAAELLGSGDGRVVIVLSPAGTDTIAQQSTPVILLIRLPSSKWRTFRQL